jgi:hypothetical protein
MFKGLQTIIIRRVLFSFFRRESGEGQAPDGARTYGTGRTNGFLPVEGMTFQNAPQSEQPAFRAPYFSTASSAYAEQVGKTGSRVGKWVKSARDKTDKRENQPLHGAASFPAKRPSFPASFRKLSSRVR